MAKLGVKVQESQDAVLDAAAKLFRLKGFASTTVREIARAAGMLPGSLHYRYSSKEQLLIALMERGVAHASDSIKSAMAESSDPLERVRLALRAHIRLLLSGDDSVYVLLYEWKTLTGTALQAIISLRDRYEALWDQILSEAAAEREMRPAVNVKLVRLLGFGAINWVPQWFNPAGDLTPEEVADAFWAYMTFGVLSDRERANFSQALMEKI
jgi:TetR/AcrR family transcriptional regulator, cholesterol catabolism regulator